MELENRLVCFDIKQLGKQLKKLGMLIIQDQVWNRVTVNRAVENIFENSDFVLMLNQAAGDRAILAKQLNISPQQMKYVTHTDAGEGLLFYGNVILPFIDRFPTDTELYKVMTTKLSEISDKRVY